MLSQWLWVAIGAVGGASLRWLIGIYVIEMLIAQKYAQAITIILLHLPGGIIAVVMGFWLGRAFA